MRRTVAQRRAERSPAYKDTAITTRSLKGWKDSITPPAPDPDDGRGREEERLLQQAAQV